MADFVNVTEQIALKLNAEWDQNQPYYQISRVEDEGTEKWSIFTFQCGIYMMHTDSTVCSSNT